MNSLINWSGSPAENFTKQFPLILIWVHFTRNSLGFFFYREILCKFFLNFQTWIGFFPHFLSKIRKLENCENLFSLNFIWANFEQDLRQFFFEKKASVAVGFWKKIQKFPKFQTWNRIFFWFCKKSCEYSKIAKIYLSWTSSEPIFSKIRGTFLISQSVSHSLLTLLESRVYLPTTINFARVYVT